MKNLNEINHAFDYIREYVNKCLVEFDGLLYGCEMGIAYGGGVEAVGKIWRYRGTVWGFDTFEGHPKQLAEKCNYTIEAGGYKAHAVYCMDPWYRDQENFGTERYKYEYIRKELDRQGLQNVVLVKGLVTEETKIDFIPKLHYVLLDMDFPIAMQDGYNLVKEKMVPGGYLCLHDVVPKGHIHGCNEVYKDILKEGLFDVVQEIPQSYLAVLRKKK